MSESTDWEQLDRYLAGELGERDAAAVRRWLMAHPDHARLLDRVNHELDYSGSLGDANPVDALVSWQVLRARAMRGDEGVSSGGFPAMGQQGTGDRSMVPMHNSKAQPLRQLLWPTLCGMVASIAILITMWRSSMQNASRQSATVMTTYLTRNGERAEIRLPDGSSVVLGVASRLELPGDYLAGDHRVRLVGEALFTVLHQTGKPFTVLAGPTVTQVLGTSFVVRRYATDTAAVIAVREGKVATYTEGVAPTVLTAARQVVFDRTGMGRVREMDPALFSFAMGILTLKGGLLPEVIPDLDRWYDVDIRLGDPTLATHHMTAKLAAGSAADLMGILEGTFNVRVVRDGRVLTLFPR